MDEGYNVREAEAAVDDEAARLLGMLQPVLVASQVGGRRSEYALESERMPFVKLVTYCKDIACFQMI